MRNFFLFLIKNSTVLLFILLEAVCLWMVVRFNDYQQSKYVSSANVVGSAVYRVENGITGYFNLGSENRTLVEENNALRNRIDMLMQHIREITDTMYVLRGLPAQQNIYREAHVIKSTTNRMRNYLTIDRGTSGGIYPNQVAVSGNGVVGLVTAASSNFAVILPLINTSMRLSAKLGGTNHRGQLVWEGLSSRHVRLIDVPEHAVVHVGDSVVTSGESDYFGEGMLIGTVSDVQMDRNGGFYNLEVELAVDFSRVYDVDVVENLRDGEMQQLMQKMEE